MHCVTFITNSIGPQNWPGICTTGKKQSPIDIVTEDAIRIDLGALKFDRYDYAFIGTLTNTGHSGKQIDCITSHFNIFRCADKSVNFYYILL